MSDQSRAAGELAIVLATMPDAVARLLEVHLDDGSGHCRICTMGNGHGNQVWPCNIAAVALCAAEIRAAGVPG